MRGLRQLRAGGGSLIPERISIKRSLSPPSQSSPKCPSAHCSLTDTHAYEKLEDWRRCYNEVRAIRHKVPISLLQWRGQPAIVRRPGNSTA
ncbi:MAG: hypothetical protein EOR78_35155 [Mesorhizobium sp.]|nr:MAG: hypothetical protein EOQ33_33385 [Mesorhizobium sp.]RWK58160.1 MAG: hypothetical protein EOR49_32610 [Mesorhizobium sp.]RWM41635.1 MAG: hypothetical protein EOR76_34325 [Mesorhizobium sp.]RWM44857.1 MAG: hypothetical protein EOR78_35155 [Mesorhizobium sp.]RWO22710.1 MAG: hypothetical protein EOS10_34675 [Mesorhizobium sp.]